MELEIFQSREGDCLLLQGSDGGIVLCDGGRSRSLTDHALDRLAGLHEDGLALDAIYVSHIDQDHIQGVERLLQNLLEWKVFERHQEEGDADVRAPDHPRPPEVQGLWHNAFRDIASRNRGRIEKLLAARAATFFGTGLARFIEEGDKLQKIATSIPQALRVSAFAGPDLLDIPLNAPPGRPDPGELLLVEEPNAPFGVGSLRFQLIGPTRRQLRRLRKGWNNWVKDDQNADRIQKIRDEMARRVEEFSTGTRPTSPFDLRDWNGVPPIGGVTAPNTASLMFLIEDDGKSLLMTGDSQQDLILEGLEETGNLDDGHLHVDVLKVSHHGSEHNADANFCQRVSADHYVFCGDGSSGNPEPDVLELFFESRMSEDPDVQILHEDAIGNPFTFWFSTPEDEGKSRYRRTVEKARELEGLSEGQLTLRFNQGDSITLRP